jgi:hypothetical protein
MLLEQIKNSTFVGNSIKMKRFLGILICILAFNSCDDGDLILEDINFEDVDTQSCDTNDIIYKLKEKEALLLEISKSVFVNEPTVPGTPTIIDIDNVTNQVVYRFYNGTISTENICNTIPPALPNVTDQWTASSGKIQIITTTIKSTDAANNSTRITGYNHNITFKNITFDKGDGTNIKHETFPFGDYTTPPTNALPFGFEQVIKQCSTSKQLYNRTSSEALTIDNIDPALIVNTETPLNTPRTAVIGSVNNKLTYRLYSNGVLTDDYFCNTTVPVLPSISEEWNAVNGGIIEVTTIKNGTTAYKHTIVLKNVVLKKGNSDFKLGDSFPYGDLITSN